MKTSRKQLKKQLRRAQIEAKSHLDSALTIKWQAANLATSNARLAREVREGEEIIRKLKDKLHAHTETMFSLRQKLKETNEYLEGIEDQSSTIESQRATIDYLIERLTGQLYNGH